jgi:hypothetical protein
MTRRARPGRLALNALRVGRRGPGEAPAQNPLDPGGPSQ